jgi:pilus assembly protein FimV
MLLSFLKICIKDFVRLTKIKLRAERALEAQNRTTRLRCWDTGQPRCTSPFSYLGGLASTAVLLCLLASSPAYALGLGRITVQSALGETLRAEIDVPQISAEEAASLRITVASAETFKAAGLEYTAAVVGIQVSLQKRPDGRSFLRLSNSRPVTELFVDLILEVSWASGRLVRDYTLLFDPPSQRQEASALAQIKPSTAPILSQPVTPPIGSLSSIPYSPSPLAPSQAASRPEPAARVRAQPPAPGASPAAPASSGQKVAVKSGDIAGRIAIQNKPASISLDQMLLALLKSNPDAFIGGNVNRLRAGTVLDIPAAEQASAVPAGEATRIISAQARDFNKFRQILAASAPAAQIGAATRQAGGQVQANVQDRAAVAALPDRLTLSKGAVQGKAAAEDKIARDKQAQDSTSRVAELTKNMDDLNKLAGASPANASQTPVSPGLQVATPGITPASPVNPTSTTAVGSATVAGTATSATTPAALQAEGVTALQDNAAAASAPVAAQKPVLVPPLSPPAPSLLDRLNDNPLVLPGLGLLLALLASFGLYRYKKRNEQSQIDSAFLESRLQPDSFFDTSGSQPIDSSKGASASESAAVYSPSQLDAAGDVDPVSEATVYLAYGRDLQAEEILKEALQTNPSRLVIHAKLTEIYAKRRDLEAFNAIAAEAQTLTLGRGPEWASICELGRDLDPTNRIYQPDGRPLSGRSPSVQSANKSALLGVDDAPSLDSPTPAQPLKSSLSSNLDPSPVVGKVAPAPVPADGVLQFDMGALSLDLDVPATENPTLAKGALATAPAMTQGPLETKLALAEEFRTLGDSDGARSLAREVVAQAEGALKTKAQALLNALS